MGNSDSFEDIIIKCPLEEMIKHFFKDYVIVWHDPNVDSKENQKYMTQLKIFCEVLTFTEWEKASAYVKDAKASCHVITSGTNGELLAKEIWMKENVVGIYVFCRNKLKHLPWAIKYQKVSCVEKKFKAVLSRIKLNVMGWYKQASSLKLSLPSFAPIFNDSDKSDMNHLHHYLKVIPRFINRKNSKKDFVSLSKSIYSDEKNAKLIKDFEKEYNEYKKEQTLTWYTAESFLYKVTNNCLRIATSDSIQYCRLLLKDIEMAIREEYQAKSKNFNGLLYRGAYLSPEEWKSLKENVDREIEMHGFLSVSKLKNVAVNFMQKDPSNKALITIIVPKGPNEEEQGFAEIKQYSRFPQEEEILFNVRSRFTVLEAEDASQDVPYRHLVLLYGAQGFRRYISERNPIKEVTVQEIGNISCAHCKVSALEMPDKMVFRSLKNPKEEIHYCKVCIGTENAPLLYIRIGENIEKIATRKVKGCLLSNSSETQALPFYGYKCGECQAKKQKCYFMCSDCGEKEKIWCENCFKEALSCAQANHNIVLEKSPFSFWCQKMSENEFKHLKFQENMADTSEFFYQGDMYFRCHEYDKAIQYYETFIQQNAAKGLTPRIATAYNNLGLVYHAQGEFREALGHFEKALEIRELHEEDDYREIALLNNNIGQMYDNLGLYNRALEFYLKSVNIVKSVHGEKHIDVANYSHNIGSLFDKLGKFEKALEYHMQSLEGKRATYGENHPQVASSYHNLGLVYYNLSELETALENYLKALEIRKTFYGENHPDVALSLNNIGLVYNDQGEYEKALKFHFKSLHISKLVCGDNLSQLALSYNNIGLAYNNQGEHEKALEYYMKTLEIEREIYGENHPHTGLTYSNIGLVYTKKEEHAEALEYYLKFLSIIKSACKGEDHPHMALAYSNVGTTYYRLGVNHKALQFCLKALEVQKAVFGEYHAHVANTYIHLAAICEGLGSAQQTSACLFKATEIRLFIGS